MIVLVLFEVLSLKFINGTPEGAEENYIARELSKHPLRERSPLVEQSKEKWDISFCEMLPLTSYVAS